MRLGFSEKVEKSNIHMCKNGRDMRREGWIFCNLFKCGWWWYSIFLNHMIKNQDEILEYFFLVFL